MERTYPKNYRKIEGTLSVSLSNLIKAVTSYPPHISALKAFRLIHRRFTSVVTKNKDLFLPSYSQTLPLGTRISSGNFKSPSLDKLRKDADKISGLSKNYLDHRFDLLGSGWIQVRHGTTCHGLEGNSYSMSSPAAHDRSGHWLKSKINFINLVKARKIWKGIDPEYIPIDWQLDFKSGYRWSEKTWQYDIKYGHVPGVDIKVPWELSRMQHLPFFVWAYALAKDGHSEFDTPDVYLREFRNQVLDFIATNPPRFGANWNCAMDVGIRIANWLVTYDLFKSQGVDFDSRFEKALIRSIYEHGQHIYSNLEWNPTLRSNHYLGNLAGLLFVSSYLTRSPEIDSWFAFSVQELVKEMESQFHPEGSNFEGSTSYHRLSSEMMVYSTALILSLPDDKLDSLKNYNHRLSPLNPKLSPPPIPLYDLPGFNKPLPFPPEYISKLEKMADFTLSVTKPNGMITQAGDNDSGRFLKLDPVFHKANVGEIKVLYKNLEHYNGQSDDDVYWVEDHLDHKHLIHAINGLFGKNDESLENFSLDTDIINGLVNGKHLPSVQINDESEKIIPSDDKHWDELLAKLDAFPEQQKQTYETPAQGDSLRAELNLKSFPEFGYYCFQSKRIYLGVRCGPVGQNGNGGHAHNDGLTVELNLDGVDRITDPGSYLYTPLPEKRNQYRSVTAHFAPQVDDREPNPIDAHLFSMEDRSQCQCLYFGEKGFIGTHKGFGAPVYRVVEIGEQDLIIKDYIDSPNLTLSKSTADNKLPFSPGYGIIER